MRLKRYLKRPSVASFHSFFKILCIMQSLSCVFPGLCRNSFCFFQQRDVKKCTDFTELMFFIQQQKRFQCWKQVIKGPSQIETWQQFRSTTGLCNHIHIVVLALMLLTEELSKGELSRIMGMITGHIGLKAHLLGLRVGCEYESKIFEHQICWKKIQEFVVHTKIP